MNLHDEFQADLRAMLERYTAQGVDPSNAAAILVGIGVAVLEIKYPQMAFAIDCLMRGFQSVSEELSRSES